MLLLKYSRASPSWWVTNVMVEYKYFYGCTRRLPWFTIPLELWRRSKESSFLYLHDSQLYSHDLKNIKKLSNKSSTYLFVSINCCYYYMIYLCIINNAMLTDWFNENNAFLLLNNNSIYNVIINCAKLLYFFFKNDKYLVFCIRWNLH